MHVACVFLQMTCQYILGMIFFPLCVMGCVFAGTGGLSVSYTLRDENPDEEQVKAISASIIVGCLGCLAVNIFGMCLICTYGRYFGVHINQRRGRSVIVFNQANTGTVFNQANTGTNVFTTQNSTQVSSLQEQNRLLQMQIQLQQQQLQQQQQQFPPPPPSYGMDPAYPPTAPPAYGAL